MPSPDRKIRPSQENVNLQDQRSDAPPQPPRSAFICFTDAKRDEIVRSHGLKDKDDVLKILAEEWRRLSHGERAYWDEEARNDKVRFVREKSEYKGPWVVPKRRAKKHPLAPKRPMSAFLKFSQKRRSMVKERNPDMSNTDVSRLLGEMWRNASAAERAPYVEQEERERAAYKAEIQKWREEQAKLDASTRASHLEVVADGLDDKPSPLPSQRQQPHPHSRDAYSDSANAYAAYEPINLYAAEEAPFMRSQGPREVFRSYSSGDSPRHSHHLQNQPPRAIEEQRPRSDASNIYSYRFGGLYNHHEHELYYRQQRNYLEHSNGSAGVAALGEVETSHSSRRRPQGTSHREDAYLGGSRQNPKGAQHGYGYYHHP